MQKVTVTTNWRSSYVAIMDNDVYWVASYLQNISTSQRIQAYIWKGERERERERDESREK